MNFDIASTTICPLKVKSMKDIKRKVGFKLVMAVRVLLSLALMHNAVQ